MITIAKIDVTEKKYIDVHVTYYKRPYELGKYILCLSPTEKTIAGMVSVGLLDVQMVTLLEVKRKSAKAEKQAVAMAMEIYRDKVRQYFGV